MLKSLIVKKTQEDIFAGCDFKYEGIPTNINEFEGGKSYCFPSQGFFIVGVTNIYLSTLSGEAKQASNVLGAIPKLIIDGNYRYLQQTYTIKLFQKVIKPENYIPLHDIHIKVKENIMEQQL